MKKSKRFISLVSSISILLVACSQPVTTKTPESTNLEDFLTGKKPSSSTDTTNTTPNQVSASEIPSSISDPNKKAVSITIVNSGVTIRVNDLVNIYGEVKYASDLKDRDISWTVSDPNIATIGAGTGILKGMKEGSVEVIATSVKDKTITAKITVKVNIADPLATPTPSATPVPTSSTFATSTPTPIATTSVSNNNSFTGKVYNILGTPVSDVLVTAKTTSSASSQWSGTTTTGIDGSYSFTNVPTGINIDITASKTGFSSKTRNTTLSLTSTSNVFDFGSSSTNTSNNFAIQDEPEIVSLKINGNLVTGSDTLNSNASIKNPDFVSGQPIVTTVDSSTVNIEIIFSEPINSTSEVDSFFKIISTSIIPTSINTSSYNIIIDKNNTNLKSVWSSDNKTVTYSLTKPLLSNSGISSELEYMIYFSSPFKDINNKLARPNKYFNFGATRNDFALFSVKNQTTIPTITSIQAINGTSSDIINITFNKSMDVIGNSSPKLLLQNPLDINSLPLQLYAYNTNTATNNATLLGYTSSANSAGMFSVYMIGKLKSADITATTTTSNTLFLKALGGGFTTTPKSYYGSSSSPITKATIANNIVTLEFSPLAFDIGDRIILSTGLGILGGYNDTVNNIKVSPIAPSLGSFTSISDPAGLPLSSTNLSTSLNFDINDAQKVSIAQ